MSSPRTRTSRRSAYRLTATAAVLVRPDGIVAWRARRAAASPEATLADVLASVLKPPANSALAAAAGQR